MIIYIALALILKIVNNDEPTRYLGSDSSNGTIICYSCSLKLGIPIILIYFNVISYSTS